MILHAQNRSVKFYQVVEGSCLDETDVLIKMKYQASGMFFIINRAFSEKRFEKLLDLADEVEKELQYYLSDGQLHSFNTMLENEQDRHAILVDYNKKTVKVFPTLDPTYERKVISCFPDLAKIN